MAHDVFVSYSSKDKPTADAVCAVLESHGIRCWVAPRDILPSHDWGGSIIEAISGARAMVLIFSANANASPQIKREVERAVNKGIPVIPLRIEDVAPTATLEYFISTPHWLDAFTPPLERHLEYLAEVTRKIVGGPEVNSAAVAEREAREQFEAEAAKLVEEKRKAAELAELKLAEEKGTAEAAEATRSAEQRHKAEEQEKLAEKERKAPEDTDHDQLLQIKKTSEGRKAAEAAPHRLRQSLRKILGSFLSTCVGWLAAILVAVDVFRHEWPPVGLMLFFGAIALLVWLLILLPLYVFVPRTSKLWRTPICSAIGAASGVLSLGFLIKLNLIEGEPHIPGFLYVMVAAFGGAACCFGAATAGYFHGPRAVKTEREAAETAESQRREERGAVETAKGVAEASKDSVSAVARPDPLMPRQLKILGYVNVFVGPLVALFGAIIAVSFPRHTGEYGSLPELGTTMFCALGVLVLVGSVGLIKEKRWGRTWSLLFALGSFAPGLVFGKWVTVTEAGLPPDFRLRESVQNGLLFWPWFSQLGILFLIMLNSSEVKTWARKMPSSFSVGQRPASDIATASFVCSLIPFCLIAQIIGLILGIVAIVEIKKSQSALGGKNLALAGVLVSSLILILMPGLFVLRRKLLHY